MKPIHKLVIFAFMIVGFCLGLYVVALGVK